VRKTPNSSLTIVEPPTFTPIAPPRKLGEAGQALWDAVQNEFRIEDCGGVELLMQACLAADRAEALAARIDKDGETIHTAMGLKAHPCLKDELAARSFICRTLQRLGITDEAIRPIGRPPRSFGLGPCRRIESRFVARSGRRCHMLRRWLCGLANCLADPPFATKRSGGNCGFVTATDCWRVVDLGDGRRAGGSTRVRSGTRTTTIMRARRYTKPDC